jgi:hypothetical protein
MSSLLEQAIIDATALKEAALKNAEAQVLERYSTEVKDAIKNLLEQEEGFNSPVASEGGTSGINGGNVGDQMTQAFKDGQKLCPCPDDEERITIDLTLGDVEGMAKETGIDLSAASGGSAMSRDQFIQSQAAQLQEGEEYEIDKAELLDLYEKLTVDARVVPYGNIEYPANTLEVEYAKDVAAAKRAQIEAEAEVEAKIEENKKLTKDYKNLQVEYKKLEKITEALANKVEQYESAVSQLKENLDKLSVTNAKLLYTNRVLNSNSLNERQKDKLVEALSNAKTTDEAKTIYQTLQSTVGGNTKVSAPKSLSEALNRPSSSVFHTKQNDTVTPEVERMRRLAGIK